MNEAKEESDTVKQQIVKMNVDMQSGFMDLMEVKLQCTICREYFIQVNGSLKICFMNVNLMFTLDISE